MKIEDIKVGDYVRTQYGIGKLIRYTDEYESFDFDNNIFLHWEGLNNTFYLDDLEEEKYVDFGNEIIKSSSNLIDLIEVGDYVNGEKVIHKDEKYNYLHFNANDTITDNFDIEIKTIMTKEKMKEMEYIV